VTLPFWQGAAHSAAPVSDALHQLKRLQAVNTISDFSYIKNSSPSVTGVDEPVGIVDMNEIARNHQENRAFCAFSGVSGEIRSSRVGVSA
jgi:hypothetical protein